MKLSEYVGGHTILTKFYNQPNPPCTPEKWPLNCPKLGYPLSKSKSFHPVFIKLGEYIGGHNISTEFFNLPNPPTPEYYGLWIVQKLNLGICSPSRISCSPKCCHYHWIYHKYDGHNFFQFGTLVFTLKKKQYTVLDEPFWLHNASKHAFLMLHLRKVKFVYSITVFWQNNF